MKFLERLRGVTYVGQMRFIAIIKVIKAERCVKHSIRVVEARSRYLLWAGYLSGKGVEQRITA